MDTTFRGNLTYDVLVTNYGQESALYILKTIERLAEIRDEIQSMDSDARLQAALDALNDVTFATKH